ncbi:MAG: pyridoxal phosphate-dependent aminotransferase [Candidatus Micrarchaeota archaeon]
MTRRLARQTKPDKKFFYDPRINKMRVHTLRVHSTARLVKEAREAGKSILESGLGDTAGHPDFRPYPRFKLWEAAINIRGLGLEGTFPEPLASCIRDPRLTQNLVHTAEMYNDALGFPPLRDAIGKWWYKFREVSIHPDNIIIGSGGSGVARLLFDLMLEKGNIVVPEELYILFTAEARRRGMKFHVVPSKGGVWDKEALRRAIDKNTRAVIDTTIGNPTGTITTAQEIIERLAIIQEKMDGKAPVTLFDTTYERWRPDGNILSPIQVARACGYPGLVIELDGFSKMWGLTGRRLGFLAVHWGGDNHAEQRERFAESSSILPQRELGSANMMTQVAAWITMTDVMEGRDLTFDGEFAPRRIQHVQENAAILLQYVSDPSNRFGISEYYGDDPRTVSPYYVIRHDDPRGLFALDKPLGWWIAKFAYDYGLPIPNTTPLAPFRLTEEGVNSGIKQTRIVLLISKQDMSALIDVLQKFDRAYAGLTSQ